MPSAVDEKHLRYLITKHVKAEIELLRLKDIEPSEERTRLVNAATKAVQVLDAAITQLYNSRVHKWI